ncbi:MAG: ATP-binding protein, partial [Betaproteobacteria bacterium]
MSAPRPVVHGNPYPGLRPFLEHEEHLFFGRERQVDAMADKLSQTHFLAVVGTSGSGKSSLVNCGLRPALHRGLITDAGSAWRVAQFRPGNAPIRALAQALAARGVLYDALPSGPFSATEMIEATLRMSSLGLLDAFEQAHLAAGVNLLVVADQFEELFRYQSLATGERKTTQHFAEESTAFVNLLLAVAEQRPPGVYVVLTMRSDFLGDCAQFAGLPEAINQGQYLVPRMNRDERRRAIEGPALMHGARIAPVLLTRLVNDVGDLPDQLSLLQHALNRTWARWAAETGEGGGRVGAGEIELRHYEAVGSMAQALDQHAEEAYARLGSEARQRIGEKVFKALTDCGTDARGVRRPTRLATLCELADAAADEVGAVIEVFRAPECCFLMPPAGEALAADTVIDISHESLMRVWRRLRDWADEEARSAASLRRLAQTAALHAEHTADLLRDPELQMALNWRARQRPNATWAAQYGVPFDVAMRFLDASEAARSKEQAAQRRALRRRQFATLAAFIAIAGTAGYFF